MQVWQQSWPTWPLVAIAGGVVIVGSIAWRRRDAPAAPWLAGLCLAAAVWALADGLGAAAATLALKLSFSKIEGLGVLAVGPCWLLMVHAFTQREPLRRRSLALLCLVPVLCLPVILANWRGLVWSSVSVVATSAGVEGRFANGPVMWALIAYTYLLAAIGVVWLIAAARSGPATYRRQAVALVAFAVLPLVANLVGQVAFSSFSQNVDLAPFAFGLGVLLLGWMLLRERFLAIAPLARDTLLRTLPDGVLVIDQQGLLIEANPSACGLLGASASTLRGPLERALREWPALLEACRERPSTMCELELGGGAAAQRRLEVRAMSLANGNGQSQGQLITLHDVTERTRAEERLASAASEWRQTFDAMSDAVALLDAEGRVLRCNTATAQLTNRTFEEIIGLPCHNVFHGSEAWHEACPLLAARESHTSESAVFEQDGRWTRVSFQPLFAGAGSFRGGVHVVSDVTALKEAELRLQGSLRQLQTVTEEVIETIVGIVEVRDPYTAGHERRVAKLAEAIAAHLGLSKEQVTGVRVAALLHDVGKIVVPSEILAKPGRLTEIEFELIKAHPRVGCEMLAGIEFPWPVAEVALQHHERLDGSGYPQGLAGEAVILEARILAVADVVEAMASHRPYRPSLGLGAALEEIEQQGGQLYDAAVTAACLALFRRDGFTFE